MIVLLLVLGVGLLLVMFYCDHSWLFEFPTSHVSWIYIAPHIHPIIINNILISFIAKFLFVFQLWWKKNNFFVKYFPKLYDAISSLVAENLVLYGHLLLFFSLSRCLVVFMLHSLVQIMSLWRYFIINFDIFVLCKIFSPLWFFYAVSFYHILCSWPYANIIKVLWVELLFSSLIIIIS